MSIRPIAMLSPAEFERARATMPELSQHETYEDWRAWREGLLIGLCRSGLESRFVHVSLDDFLVWRQERAMPASEAALDVFALLSEFFGVARG